MHVTYFHAASRVPFLYQSLAGLPQHSADKWGEKEAVCFPFQGIRKSFTHLFEDVKKVSAALYNLGLAKGDRVAHFSYNTYESLVGLLAFWRLGVITVLIDPATRSSGLSDILLWTEAKAVLVGKGVKGMDSLGTTKDALSDKKRLSEVVILTAEKDGGCENSVETWLKEKEPPRLFSPENSSSPDDVIAIAFTSGTTGRPKGVQFTNHAIMNTAHFWGKRLGHHKSIGICLATQMHHGVTIASAIMAFLGGHRLLFPCHGYNPKEIQQTLEAYPSEFLIGSPTILYDIAANGGNQSVSQLIYTGACCNTTHLAAFKQGFPKAQLSSVYGLSETTSIFTNGRVMDHLELKISGEGELFVRGYGVTPGYWRDPESTRKAIDEFGWFRTGDLCKIGEGGVGCQILGRCKEVINRGGDKIRPKEIEDIIYLMPGVKEAVVFGLSNPRLGEEIAVWVIPKKGFCLNENDVREFCLEKLAHFKVPKVIHFTTSIPKTSLGKPKKVEMAKCTKLILSQGD